jgi:hypothetical protein
MSHSNSNEKDNNYNSEKENINAGLKKSTFKDIKNIKDRKLLLSKFINEINDNIPDGDEMIKQKNNLVLKSICSNIKYINDENIILDYDNIIKIIGININNKGLIIINKSLYKDHKIPK